MNEKILCVDDELNILDGFRRSLRNRFQLDTATSGAQALELLRLQGPYAVVVVDMRMPEMDGLQFLVRAQELAPHMVRIMLTGNADQQTAVNAVNEGHVFRFLNKPCAPESLAKALNAGLEQYRLVMAEKELLEQTLSGCVKMLVEVMSLVNPEAFGRSARISRLAKAIAVQMGVGDDWKISTGALLSQVGGIVLPEAVLRKLGQGQPLDEPERQLYEQHPFVAYDLLKKIPRMNDVADIIRYQEKLWDGSGVPRDGRKGTEIPLGSRILKAALDFDILEAAGCSKLEALDYLQQRARWYDPAVLDALKRAFSAEITYETQLVSVGALVPGMILADDVHRDAGVLLIGKGQELTETMIKHLNHFCQMKRVSELIRVLVPQEKPEPMEMPTVLTTSTRL